MCRLTVYLVSFTLLPGALLLSQDISWADAEYKNAKELFNQEKYAEAEQGFQNALGVYRQESDTKWELYSLEYLAKLYNKTQRFDEAIAMNLQCLTLAGSISDMEGIGLANNRLGINYYNKGDFASAAIYYQAALAQSRQTGKKEDVTIDLQNLIDAYQRLGKYDESSKYEAEKNQLEGTTGLDALTITDSDNLKRTGEEKMKSGNYAGALEDLQQALMFYRSKNDEQYLKLTMENVSRCHYYLGQYDQALSLANEALYFAKKTNDHYGQGLDINTIGMCQYYKGQQSAALGSFMTAYSLNGMDGSSKGELKTTVYFLSQIYKQMGDYSAAAPYEQQYNQLTAQGF